MIQLVSSVGKLKNRIKKLLTLSAYDTLFLNYLAEIWMFWCGTRKNHEKSFGKCEIEVMKCWSQTLYKQ
jgi:hypothetical protein